MRFYEWKRKLWHVGVGILGLITHYGLDKGKLFSATLLLSAATIMFIVEFSRLKLPSLNRQVLAVMGPFMRKKETNQISGMPFYALGVGLTFLIFPEQIGIIGICILVFVDPICSLIGKNYGNTKLFFGKTVEGTMAGFVMSNIVITICLILQQDFSPNIIMFAIIGAVLCALSELFVIIDDNLSLPLLAAGSLWVLNNWLLII